MKRWWLLLLPLSVWMVGFWNPLRGYLPWPVASGFEITPAGATDFVSQGDDRIREFKEQVRIRMQTEHYFGTGVSADDNGRHREGSASAWNAAPCPTANLTGDPSSGSPSYTANDEGKLCHQSTDGSFRIYNGSAYVSALSAIMNNSLGHWADNTAPVDTFDPTKFHIRNIVQDVTNDTTNCPNSGLTATVYASQTFANSCFTTGSIDLSARSTTSRAVILATYTVSKGTAGVLTCSFGVFRDAMANQVGPLIQIADGSNSTSPIGWTGTYIYYVTGISAAAHEFNIHGLKNTGSVGCIPAADPNAGSLTYIDLGPEY